MSGESVSREEFAQYIAQALDINRFRDYCPNGLQVEGRGEIRTLVTGVTASLALLEAAAEAGADAILVHHGYFWRGEDGRVVGTRRKRLQLLLTRDINLFAYHLPLDHHPDYGNNARLAAQLGLIGDGRFGENDIGWLGTTVPGGAQTAGGMAQLVGQRLDRAPLLIGDPEQPVRRIAWCTGAAQNMLEAAVAAGADIFLSGEISEPTVHLAREAGVAYLACGHHATERYGVQALGEHLAVRFGISHRFIDIPNPV